jgi:hypothetical protein
MRITLLFPLAVLFSALSGCAGMPPPQVDWENFRPFQPIPNFIAPAQSPTGYAQSSYAPQSGVSAVWTGRQNQIQTVTNQQAWNCEYQYSGQSIWRVFSSSCPSAIRLQ